MLTATIEDRRTHAIHFVVRGRSRFPLDMLRRDDCTFSIEADALHAEATYVGYEAESHFFALFSHRDSKYWEPSVARWKSFGFEVVELSQTSDPHSPITLAPL